MTTAGRLPPSSDPKRGATLLDVEELCVVLGEGTDAILAVDSASFTLARGEVLAVVGESGSGKTALCLSLIGLLPTPTGRPRSGRIRLAAAGGSPAIDLARATDAELRAVRGRTVGMVFQDPMTALNPYLRVGTQVGEALAHHHGTRGTALRRAIEAALSEVGLPRPAEIADRYPHELSGGMRQRVLIAAALAPEPELLIADEPTTALDVTIQAQVLDLVGDIVRARSLAVLWVTHDLGVVARIADRVAVMFAGRIVEQGSVEEVIGSPAHPYTRELRQAVTSLECVRPRATSRQPEPRPTSAARGGGCSFRARCPWAEARCATEVPPARSIGRGHVVCCHLAAEEP